MLLVSPGSVGGMPKPGPLLIPSISQAREMTLQAMALQQQPLNPAPKLLPPEVSCVLHQGSSAPL